MRVRSEEFSRILNSDPNIFGVFKPFRKSQLSNGRNGMDRIQSGVYYYSESIHIEYVSITYNYRSVRLMNDLNSVQNLEIPKWKMMKLESNTMFEEFVRFVEDMIRGQIEEGKKLKLERAKRLKKLRRWAQEQISDGGYWSPEAVAKRIVEFAKSVSGGDTSKIPLLKDAVKKAFDEVRERFGGKLPEISEKTYKLVIKKLEEWEKKEPRI